MPIDPDLIIFTSEDDYTDNSYALYLFIKEHYSNYRLVWATIKENPKYHHEVKHVHHPYHYTFKSAWYLSRAKYLFTTHGFGINFYPRASQKALYIGHGIVLKARKDPYFEQSHISNRPNFTKAVYLADFNIDNVARWLKCDTSYCELIGYPRNDVLLNNNQVGLTNPFVSNGFNGKVLIWMPTYRISRNNALSEMQCYTPTGLPLLQTEQELRAFDDFLNANNLFIIAKIHHLQADNVLFKQKFKNFRFLVDNEIFDKGLQVYEVVGRTDALISDYSSISNDYILTDKPMGFILDDIKEYESSRGLMYDDIKPLLPGHHIYTVDDFKSFCLDVANGIDNYKVDRKRVRDLMIKYQDNRSCERICAWAGIK